jgi:hypothetical protein
MKIGKDDSEISVWSGQRRSLHLQGNDIDQRFHLLSMVEQGPCSWKTSTNDSGTSYRIFMKQLVWVPHKSPPDLRSAKTMDV